MKYIGTMLSVFQHHNCICQVMIWTPEGPISYASESLIVIFLPWYNCCVYVLNDNKMFLNWIEKKRFKKQSLFTSSPTRSSGDGTSAPSVVVDGYQFCVTYTADRKPIPCETVVKWTVFTYCLNIPPFGPAIIPTDPRRNLIWTCN